MNINDILGNVKKTIKINAPEIFTGLGVSGVVTTGYLSAKATFKASNRLSEAPGYLSFKEKTKLVWKDYIPPAVAGAVTIGFIIASNRSSNQRTAAAVAAYSVTEKLFSEYREKVVEEIGKGKEQKVRDELAQDQVNKTPPKEVEIISINGTVLCCELYTGRYFRSDMESLRKAQNDLNGILISQIYASLDEFYELIGLPSTSNSMFLGWDSDKFLDLKFSTVISDGGEPCLAFEYNDVKPIRGL